MNSRKLLVLALFAIVLSVFSLGVFAEEEAAQNENSDVVVLTTESFEEGIKKTEFTLVEFFAPWCPHCKKLAPEYEKAATQLKEHGVTVASVDCDKETKICQDFQIPGFPTLKLFKNSKPFRDYEDERTAEAIVNWILKRTGPSAKPLKDQGELDDLVAKSDVTVVVGTFANKDSDAHKQFIAAADDQDLEDFVFAEMTGSEDSIKLYRPFEPKVVEYKGKFVHEDIEAFVLQKGYPLVDEINAKSFRRFIASENPLAIVFLDYEDAEAKKNIIEMFNEVAEELAGKMQFGYSDGKIYGQQLEIMGGDPEKLPGVAAMNIQKRQNFPFTKELTKENLINWAKDIVEGREKPFMRSDPVPETNDEPVKVIVGKNFEDIVMDETKDVLVEFYAPWCGHCKRLAPVYEKLAKFFEPVKNLVIAKIDATTNDTPVSIEGFPTIYFFPSNRKDSPIQYEGDRTLKDLRKFIRTNSVASKEEINELRKKLIAEKKAELEKEKKDEL